MHDVLCRDGVLHLPGLLNPAQVGLATATVRTALADGLDASGVRVFFPATLDPALRDLVAAGGVARTVDRLLGPSEFLSLKPVVKDGTTHAFATPWHQDRPYWGGCAKWSLWIALTPVGVDDGCLRIVRGSHTREMTHTGHQGGIGFSNRLPEPDPSLIEDVILAAGDAVIFHDLLWHASRPAAPGRSRVALIPTYRPQESRDTSTIWSSALPLQVA